MSELLEKIPDKRSMNEEYKKVRANKGAGGVDGMEIEELAGYIRKNCDSIREQIRKELYHPIKKRPVRYNTGNQLYVQAAVFRAQLRIPSEQEL